MQPDKTTDTVLVVDDEAAIRDLLQRIVRTIPHTFPVAASGAEEALRCAAESPPSLIISDLNMPDKTGLWLLSNIRRRDTTLPFVIFSGSLTSEDESILLNHGASRVIAKPASAIALRNMMLEMLSRNVRFEMVAHVGSVVHLTGTFNDWNPSQLRMVDEPHAGIFSITLRLPRGHYEYKFVVDGVWQADPRNPQWVPNGLTTTNSVLEV